MELTPRTTCPARIERSGKLIRKININIDDNGFRKTSDQNFSTYKPIIFFGCSYTFGYGLNDNETFPWKISETTNRKTYNAGFNGYGPQHMLLMLKSKRFYKKVPTADTIVYIYMDDQMNRPSGYDHLDDPLYPMYKLNNSELLYYTTPIGIANSPKKLKLYKTAKYNLANKIDRDSKGAIDLFVAIIKESKDIAVKKYPNVRFIFFDLENKENLDAELKKNGIEFLRLKDIFNEENIAEKYYTIDYHPNAEFWQKVSPRFIEKLGL